MMRELTKRQKDVLDFIWERVRKKQPPPTVREIGDHFGIGATNGVTGHLRALERKGQIVHDADASRGIRLTPAARKHLSGIPFLDINLV